MSKEQVLQKLYYDVGSEAGFSSVEKLYNLARKQIKTITKDEIKQWLRGQITYTLHYPARRHFNRNPVVASSVGELCQADLVDMQTFSSANDGYNYLLTFIDVFSKKAFAIPIKSKHASEIIKAFKKIFDHIRPFMIQTDRGTEFTNARLTAFLDRMGVKLYFAYNQDTKASVVERFNRTLKAKMFKYFTARGSRRYIDVIDQLLQSYNNSYHQSIRMRPNEVPQADPRHVFENLYGFESERQMLDTPTSENTVFQIGQSVRLKYHIEPMDKGFYPNYEDRVYTIRKIIKRFPRHMYQLADEQGNILPRKAYAEDLQLVSPDTAYRIEKILGKRTRRGKREVLVKWLNHPPSFNSWIPETNIQSVGNV